MLKNVAWWVFQGIFVAMAVTVFVAPALCAKLILPFFWITVLIGPYA